MQYAMPNSAFPSEFFKSKIGERAEERLQQINEAALAGEGDRKRDRFCLPPTAMLDSALCLAAVDNQTSCPNCAQFNRHQNQTRRESLSIGPLK